MKRAKNYPTKEKPQILNKIFRIVKTSFSKALGSLNRSIDFPDFFSNREAQFTFNLRYLEKHVPQHRWFWDLITAACSVASSTKIFPWSPIAEELSSTSLPYFFLLFNSSSFLLILGVWAVMPESSPIQFWDNDETRPVLQILLTIAR